MIDRDNKTVSSMDLGWLYNLPKGLVYVSYDRLYVFGRIEMINTTHKTFSNVVDFIKNNSRLKSKLEESANIIAEYEEMDKVVKQNIELLSKYRIKDLVCGLDVGRFYIHIEFENFSSEQRFSYYFRTNCKYFTVGTLKKLITRILKKGEDGLREYDEWVKVAKVFKRHNVSIGWYKYFRLQGDKMILKGKDWNQTWWDNVSPKLVDICKKRENDWVIDYNGSEGFETLLDLLEG